MILGHNKVVLCPLRCYVHARRRNEILWGGLYFWDNLGTYFSGVQKECDEHL